MSSGRGDVRLCVHTHTLHNTYTLVNYKFSGWDLRLEKQAIAAYAARFAPDNDTLDQFVPRVTAALQHNTGFDGRAYDLGALPAVNRQKLQRRLWAALKREVERLPDGNPLRVAMRQKANGGKVCSESDWGGC